MSLFYTDTPKGFELMAYNWQNIHLNRRCHTWDWENKKGNISKFKTAGLVTDLLNLSKIFGSWTEIWPEVGFSVYASNFYVKKIHKAKPEGL